MENIYCNKCKAQVGGVDYHRCSYCGLPHCLDHSFPENHNCSGIMKMKNKAEEDWKRMILEKKLQKEYQPFRYKGIVKVKPQKNWFKRMLDKLKGIYD